jgi:AcrR family transcriptional regulator
MALISPIPASGRRQRKRLETERKILNAAMELFAERGFQETTIEQITEAADIGKGTFFNYFPGKEQLLVVFLHAFAEPFQRFGEGAAQARDVREYVRAFMHDRLQFPSRSPLLLRNILGNALSNETIAAPLLQTMQTARAAITRVMERGQQTGEVRRDISAAELGRNFQQFILGTELIWALEGGGDLHARADQMLDLYFQGIAPRPAAPPSRGK